MDALNSSSSLPVHMIGAEWFDSIAGGLNRYFESLFLVMSDDARCSVTASAFGDAIARGESLGPVDAPVVSRMIASSRIPKLGNASIVDRHFALYGYLEPPRPVGKRVTHFQGPWAGESAAAGSGALAVKAKYLWERAAYGRSDAFIVLCQRFKELLVETYRVDPDIVSVIAPGVDLQRFVAREPQDGPPVVLCTRRLERRMGIDVLVNAWLSVVAAHPEARLSIVGTGTYEKDLRTLASDLQLEDSITFEGRVTDERLADLYAASAFTVVPSLTLEGFGLIALESLASGRAPIVTDCGGLPDSVVGLDPSLIVPPADEHALAARIDGALRGKVPSSAQCRTHAETFDWKSVSDRHLDLYAQLVA